MPESRLPVPPLSASSFGLIQEKIYDNQYYLLIAVTLLNVTSGNQAIPTFQALIQKYPTPQNLATANKNEVKRLISHLGLGKRRTKTLMGLSRIFLNNPPIQGTLYRTSGRGKEAYDMRELEIAHIPGTGRYAYDSWRIFCRDVVLGLADDFQGTGSNDTNYEPEWKRVRPRDKELRAFITWMWRKEGYYYHVETGEIYRLDEQEDYLRQLMEAAISS